MLRGVTELLSCSNLWRSRTGRWIRSNEAPVPLASTLNALLFAIVGMIMNFDPIRALYWSAVINGVVAVPVMAIMIWLAAAPRVMGDFVITGWTKALGWVATAVMAVAIAALLATS